VRTGGQWVSVQGELHTRSRQGEAEALLQAARAAA
jgi:hypothetical protein